MDIKFRLPALQKLAGLALIVLVSVGLIGIAALHPAHAQDAAPPVLDDACSKQAPNPLPFHVQPLSIASGYHRGAAVGAAAPIIVPNSFFSTEAIASKLYPEQLIQQIESGKTAFPEL